LPYEQIYQSGVLLLSMSYGRSVLCSDLPAFSEVLKDDYNGFLFEKGNAKALAEKIRAIYFEPYLLKNVEINMKQSLDADYSWTKIAEKTVNFYNEFVK
jgi:glycosyltransferase involved in cell wall biosynthesis